MSTKKKVYLIVLDENGNIAFNILNGKKPGVFVEDTISDDLALVLDPINLLNPLESFDLLINISQSLQDFFGCDLLDEDRNLLTKQMIEHMREQVLEYKRQFLASTG
jgi:Cell division protein